MKVRYVGESDPLSLINGKEYDVLAIEDGLYRIIDEEGSDPDEQTPGYLYDPDSFEIVEGGPDEFTDKFSDS